MKNERFLGLRTCIYSVPDMNAAKEWYSKAFETTPYFDEPFYIGFNIAGYELGLTPEKTPFEKKSENVFTYWGVENVEKEFERLITLGCTGFEPPENVGDGIITASLKDPWKNIIGLIYNPTFKLP